MKERPILFSGPMVRALQNRTKSQTRRVVKPSLTDSGNFLHACNVALAHKHIGEWRQQDGRWFGLAGYTTLAYADCPYGQIGDRLWVREAWSTHANLDHMAPRDIQARSVHYWADGDIQTGKRRPGMFMPRWASRILLEVTAVRVERLQDISEADAIAEGISVHNADGTCDCGRTTYNGGGILTRYSAVEAYRDLWESINGAGSWNASPWVWVISFKRVSS